VKADEQNGSLSDSSSGNPRAWRHADAGTARGIAEPTPGLRRAIVVADKTPKLLGNHGPKRQDRTPAGGIAVAAGNPAAAP
jgi:hypothetical protein